MAKPIRRPRSARAIATGLDPHTMISGRGSTGSTKMSMVPWLGQEFLAKRTPSRSSPAATPASSRRSPGWMEISLAWPSASDSLAAFNTAERAQLPPIQPSETAPSARITALAPALAAVAETVLTTVASTKGSPSAFMDEIRSWISGARFTRAFSDQCDTILFHDWGGDPVSKRSKGDAPASFEIGSALGARQSETRRDELFCANSCARSLDRIQIRSSIPYLILSQNRSVRMGQIGRKML